MDKLKMHSPDLSQDNISKIRALFPNCVTESSDDNGKVKLAIDFDQLKQELSDSIVEGPQERYQLNWPGKREALLTANAPIAKTLRPCREESVNFDTTENLFIEGDNLEALKLLQETYLGKVNVIFIDPPYNTGNDFIYNDNFSKKTGEYLEQSKQIDSDKSLLTTNAETDGRYHSNWLSMIYPRLKLSRNLLADNGAIFIAIDDNESDNLIKCCNEIFGENNFIANVAWKHTQQSKNDERYFSRNYNNIIIYRKSDELSGFSLARTEEDNKNYKNPDNDPKGSWRAGDVRSPSYRSTLCFDLTTPSGKLISPPENGWRWSEDTIKEKITSGEIVFSPDEAKIIRKIYLCNQDGRTPENLWLGTDAGTTREANTEIKSLFDGKAVFDTPKPTKLISRIIDLYPKSNNELIVLDFFAGSATTAEAVIKFNNENKTNHKFIMVQLDEPTNIKSEGFKMGYKTISELSRERVRRATLVLKNKENIDNNLGFRSLRIDSTNMSEVYYNPEKINQEDMFAQVEKIKEDRTDEDLLFQVLLDWGVGLTLPISKQQLSSKDVFFVNANEDGEGADLIACFGKDISNELIKTLAEKQPLRVVFRDDGFANDSVKINVEQIFKQISPMTDVKSI